MTDTATAPHPVSAHPTQRVRSTAPATLGKWIDVRADLGDDHAHVFHGHVRTGTLTTVREALTKIADKIARKMPGIRVHAFADDAGMMPRCTTHREFRCWHAGTESGCRIADDHATEITVTVTGAPVWDGVWRPAGSLSVDSLGVVTAKTFGTDDDLASRHRELAGQCAHCRKTRKRAVTVLMHNAATGEVRPVGRSCLDDYTGGTVRADLLADLLALGERVAQAFGVIAAGEPDSAPTVDVVAIAQKIVDRYGFIRSGQGTRTQDDTRTQLRKTIAPAIGEGPVDFAPAELTEAERQHARDAIAAVLADQGTGDYLGNMQAVVAQEWCQITGKGSKLGLLASLPNAAERAHEAALRRAEREREEAARKTLPDAWIGEVDTKVEFTGRVDSAVEHHTDYGYTYLVKVETPDGLVKMWTKAAAMVELEAGQVVTIAGTVKAHDEYKGRRETTISRPKLVGVRESAPV